VERAATALKAAPSAGQTYACPMHPEVTAQTPGQCPSCKMDLEPVSRSAQSAVAANVTVGAEKPESPPAALIPVSKAHFAPGVLWLPETFPPAQPGKPQDRPPIGALKRRVFVDDVRAAAWLEKPDRLAAVLYRDELIGLSSGELGTFYRAAAPRTAVEVRLSDEPPTPWDTSTSLVHFSVAPRKAKRAGGRAPAPPEAQQLRSGDVGWLELPPRSRELLVFPESALLRSTEGPYVLVPTNDEQTFARRPVEIGRILRGQVVVLSGLREGDPLVVGKAFFLDAEARLEFRAEPMAKVTP
jgi:hypothetical protein